MATAAGTVPPGPVVVIIVGVATAVRIPTATGASAEDAAEQTTPAARPLITTAAPVAFQQIENLTKHR